MQIVRKNIANDSKGTKSFIGGCMDCHGGGDPGGIHGSSRGLGSLGSDEMGKRFMNGDTWAGHTLGDISNNQLYCYTGASPWSAGSYMSTCNQHSGGKKVDPIYWYQWSNPN